MSGEVLASIMTLCLVIGVSVGAAGMSSVWKEKMVEYGHAQYCPDTGAWACDGEDGNAYGRIGVKNSPGDLIAEWQDDTPTPSRAHILDTAKAAVTQDRQATHGNPEDTFGLIAAYWSAHLDTPISASDVGVMMSLFKLARIKGNPKHLDSYTDAAGYIACAAEVAG